MRSVFTLKALEHS